MWQFDQGGNLLSENYSVCDSFEQTAVTGHTWNTTKSIENNSYTTVATAVGKHLDGTIRCQSTASTTISKGTKIRFKAPTIVTPALICHPWGIDLAGQPEALCVVDNQTGYTIGSVNLKQCSADTNGTKCGTYDATKEPAVDPIVSSHCYNLISKETGTGLKGHKCSVRILGTDNKRTPVMWAEAVSPDASQVQFRETRPVRIPKWENWPEIQVASIDADLGTTCTANTTYGADQAAACASSNAGKIDTNIDTTKKPGIAHYKTGISGGEVNCTNNANHRNFKVEYVAIGDVPPLWNDGDNATFNHIEHLSIGNDVIFNADKSCTEGKDLVSGGKCKFEFTSQGPYFEGVFKLWTADAINNKATTPLIIRTGEAPICPVDGY